MALTSREILENMVKRINEKTGFNIQLVENRKRYTLANTPFPISFNARTALQMIDYLAGMEDVFDYYTTKGD